jgi:hypothetical protein
MTRKLLSMPELAIISGTRAALGAGIGLLVADKLTKERRKGIGWALLSIGLASTIPILIQLVRSENHVLGNGTQRTLPRQKTVARKSSRLRQPVLSTN